MDTPGGGRIEEPAGIKVIKVSSSPSPSSSSSSRMGGTLMDTPGGGKDGSGPAGIREFRPWRLVSPVQWGVSTEHGHAPANIIQIQNSNTI